MPVSLHQRLEQLGQREAVAAIAPIVREILRDEIHLARALRLEQLRLAHHLVERERAMLAAHERNRAERAAVVAPFAHLEVADVRRVAGEEPHAGMDRRHVVDQAARLELGQQAVHLGGAEKQIDLGQRLLELALVALHHAPHRDDRLADAVVLHAARFDDARRATPSSPRR